MQWLSLKKWSCIYCRCECAVNELHIKMKVGMSKCIALNVSNLFQSFFHYPYLTLYFKVSTNAWCRRYCCNILLSLIYKNNAICIYSYLKYMLKSVFISLDSAIFLSAVGNCQWEVHESERTLIWSNGQKQWLSKEGHPFLAQSHHKLQQNKTPYEQQNGQSN